MIPDVNILRVADNAVVEQLLLRSYIVRAAVGERSARAALEAATLLFKGDVWQTIKFMNQPAPGLRGERPIESSEHSDEDLEVVLRLIGAIEAGVYI